MVYYVGLMYCLTIEISLSLFFLLFVELEIIFSMGVNLMVNGLALNEVKNSLNMR